MKNLHNIFKITLFAAQFSFSPIWGQGDTTKVSYSEESGTLEKQRFIDRYDYVFMTKEPTKWMLKGLVEPSLGLFSNTPWSLVRSGLGLEAKLLPSWSVGVNAFVPVGDRNMSYFFEGYSRFYYNMNRRIKEGKSVNNFSGNYLGLQYRYMRQKQSSLSFGNTIELQYGVQRRFFKHGLVDFLVNFGHTEWDFIIPANSEQMTFKTWSFNTNWRIGLAVGDLRKTKSKLPFCEVLNCLQEQKGMLKVTMPNLNINSFNQNFNTSIAYEKLLGKSPISINLEYNTNWWHMKFFSANNQTSTNRWENWFRGEMRCYLGMEQRVKEGKSARNLNGLYAGLQVGVADIRSGGSLNGISKGTKWIAPIVGFQQTIFQNGFIDFRVGIPLSALDSQLKMQGFSTRVSDFKIGFAF